MTSSSTGQKPDVVSVEEEWRQLCLLIVSPPQNMLHNTGQNDSMTFSSVVTASGRRCTLTVSANWTKLIDLGRRCLHMVPLAAWISDDRRGRMRLDTLNHLTMQSANYPGEKKLSATIKTSSVSQGALHLFILGAVQESKAQGSGVGEELFQLCPPSFACVILRGGQHGEPSTIMEDWP